MRFQSIWCTSKGGLNSSDSSLGDWPLTPLCEDPPGLQITSALGQKHPNVVFWRVFSGQVHSFPIPKTPFTTDSNEGTALGRSLGGKFRMRDQSSLPKMPISLFNNPKRLLHPSLISADFSPPSAPQDSPQAVLLWTVHHYQQIVGAATIKQGRCKTKLREPLQLTIIVPISFRAA